MKKLLCVLGLATCFQFCEAQLYYDFSNSQSSFTPISGGIIPFLTPSFLSQKTLLDESYVNNIPIGFTFQYNGINVTKLHLNSNGFAALGVPFLSGDVVNPDYDINELRNGSGLKATIRPVLAPFWDDLVFSTNGGLSYKTTGVAPNQVFTAQWQNMIWQNGTAAISFQLKLYESTNVIEFVYQSEAGSGGGNKSASIGISSENNQQELIEIDSINFMSLSSAASTATIVSETEMDSIQIKPSSGQLFRFIPMACAPVSGIQLSGCSNNAAVIKWNAKQGNPSFEYAIGNIDVAPVTGTTSADTSIRFDGLSDNTNYYFYIKNTCSSIWKKFSFKTTANGTLPYKEGFESTLDTELPGNMSSQNNSNNFANVFWQTTDLLTPAAGSKVAFNASPYVNAGTWLFTPSFNMIAGQLYSVGYKISTTGGSHALEIKYGKYAGEDSMMYNINIDTNIVNTAYQTKEFIFIPPATGDYTIGLGYKAKVNSKLLLIDELSVKNNGVVLAVANTFTATLTGNREVKLAWKNSNDRTADYFVIERSTDGNNFEALGRINHTASSSTNGNYEYYDRLPKDGINYYRIRLVENSGQIILSPIQNIRLNDHLITGLYPNPSAKEVFVKMSNTEGISIRVFTLGGAMVPVSANIISRNEIKIVPTAPLPSGIYLVNIISKTETRILKWSVL